MFVLNFYFNFINIEDVVTLKHVPHSKQSTGQSNGHSSSHGLNLSCAINDRQAILALKRMKTAKCQQTCIDVFCSVNKHKPWPDELISRCNQYGIFLN